MKTTKKTIKNVHLSWLSSIIGGFGSGKPNALLHLIKKQYDIDKIYFYARDLREAKYVFLIKKRRYAGTNHLSDPNAIIEC